MPAKINRKAGAAALGYRPLTNAEKRKIGMATSKRAYAPVATKKVTRATKLKSRRDIEKQILGKSFERAARENQQRDIAYGLRAPDWQRKYNWLRDQYEYWTGLTRGDIRTSADFKALYADWRASNWGHPKTKSQETKARRALERIGLRDPSWSAGVGDTPSGLGREHQDSGAKGHYQGYDYRQETRET